MGGTEAVAPLVLAAGSEDPKLRKNVATALGRLGGEAAVEALGARLAAEELDYVRAAVVLALGRIELPSAAATLEAWTPTSEADEDVAVRVLGRGDSAPAVDFDRDAPWTLRVYLKTPIGLEDAVAEEVRELDVAVAGTSAGRVELGRGEPPWRVWPLVRGAYAVRVFGGKNPEKAVSTVLRTLTNVAGSSWRLHADKRRTRAEFRSFLGRLRRKLRPLETRDQPSEYDYQWVWADDGSLEFEPSFLGDDRFAYRRKDVGASIHPVVGATLARLVKSGPKAHVHDPTCGSATLLIERAKLGAGRLTGTDISTVAVDAATTNLEAANVTAQIRQGDAQDAGVWPERVDEVLVNLPFGVRTREDGPMVTRAVVEQVDRKLRTTGRALFYTSLVDDLVAALRDAERLKIVDRYDVEAGGIHVVALVCRAS